MREGEQFSLGLAEGGERGGGRERERERRVREAERERKSERSRGRTQRSISVPQRPALHERPVAH
jgi:hypothetical protein